MELFLDMKKFQRRFAKAQGVPKSSDPFFGLPDTVDRDSFSRFYRVMAAENMEELEDISLEELLDMWSKSYQYADYFEGGIDLSSKAVKFLASSTAPAIKRRRVL